MTNLEILTADQAIAAQKLIPGAGDKTANMMAQASIDSRMPAFWSMHSYHNQAYGRAARLANDHGISHAIDYLLTICHDRNMAGRAFVAAFLAGLCPANEEGQRELAAALLYFSMVAV